MSMQTKRDQLRAYLFIVNRVKAALLRANPDSAAIPFRRIISATIVGLLLTVIIGGVFALIGLINPGNNTSWREAPVILAEDTGTRFVFDQNGQVLHPVINHASAMLLGGAAMKAVSEKSLSGVRRGVPVGIAGAPDDVPAAADLSAAPPLACARPAAVNAPAGTRSAMLLVVGNPPPTQPLADQAVLVAAPGEKLHLVWRGQRFAVPNRDMRTAIGLGGVEPIPVPTSWLNTLTARGALRLPAMPRHGQPPSSPVSVDGARVGQVLVIEMPNGTKQYQLVTDGGLAPVSEFTAQLVLGDARTANAYPDEAPTAQTVSSSVVASADAAEPPDGVSRFWPSVMPAVARLNPEQTSLCSGSTDAGPTVKVTAAAALPATESDRTTTVVQPGGGLLVRAAGASGVASGGLYLITDQGIRYPIPSGKAAELLGYAGSPPVPVDSGLLAEIPEGPALDPLAARTPQPPLGASQP